MAVRPGAATRRSLLLLALVAMGSAATAQPTPQACTIHLYPAEKLRSVGEDFDAVHKLDQDLQAYERAAGGPLGWLTPARQLDVAKSIDFGKLAGLDGPGTPLPQPPLTRRQALAPGPHVTGFGCLLEVAVPQVLLERGGLASRSLRLFGVVRLYRDDRLVRGFSGFASAPMNGFRLKSPADLPASTALVEAAYREAVAKLMIASLPTTK